jgi:hypothetical protein
MKHSLRTFIFTLPMVLAVVGQAQTIMDITMVPGMNNDLEVKLRPDTDFDGVVAGMVFTIRWSNASGANIGAIAQETLASDVCHVSKSGPEQVIGDYRYQVLVAFGITPLTEIPYVMTGAVEFTLCTLSVVNATDVFYIVNDDWTSVNNADYFVSLNGANATGVIYDQSTGVEQGVAVSDVLSVRPNLVSEQAIITLNMESPNALDLDLLDAHGSIIRHQRTASGSRSEILDMRGMASGLYTIRMTAGDLVRTARLVKK